MPFFRCALLSVLLGSSLAEARGVYASALWFDSSSMPPTSWQQLTLAQPAREDCTEFARSLPKSVQEQLGSLAAFEAMNSYQHVCAIGPAHVLIGLGPRENAQHQVLLQTLEPSKGVETTSNKQKQTVTVKLDTGQRLQLPPTGQFCDRTTTVVSQSATRTLVFQSCLVLD